MNICTERHPVQEIIAAQKRGEAAGIYSCCSANPYVIKAALLRGRKYGTPVLIEATANQVDQFGGYSGMKPADFVEFVGRLVDEVGIDPRLVLLGGDHLGPLTFAREDEAQAMEKASVLVREYVLAGFSKIHIDTSMRLGSDKKGEPLTDETIARRGAELCRAAEVAYAQRASEHPEAQPPVYIIGSEVPIPGGAQEEEDSVSVTSPEACKKTLSAFREAFLTRGLESALPRVVGVVVQPGVEFGDQQVICYDREKARELVRVLDDEPSIVFEGHSTDYQTKYALREMVEDGIAILKVGPALTFALREALLALECMERELLRHRQVWLSSFRETLENEMLDAPENWEKHYHGSETQRRFARVYSFSDRARYYLARPNVRGSIERLINNLSGVDIPVTLISQYMPAQYYAVAEGRLGRAPEALLLDRIGNCIDDYLYATGIID